MVMIERCIVRNPVDHPLETQQMRMLERLRQTGKQPVTLEQLRAGGIDFPAVVIGELELNGYVIERVYEHGRPIGVRLLETEPTDPPATRRRHRWRQALDSPRCARRPGAWARGGRHSPPERSSAASAADSVTKVQTC